MYLEFEQAWCVDLHNGLVEIMIVSYFLIPITIIMAICAVMIVMRSKVDVPRYSPSSEKDEESKGRGEVEQPDQIKKNRCCSCC